MYMVKKKYADVLLPIVTVAKEVFAQFVQKWRAKPIGVVRSLQTVGGQLH